MDCLQRYMNTVRNADIAAGERAALIGLMSMAKSSSLNRKQVRLLEVMKLEKIRGMQPGHAWRLLGSSLERQEIASLIWDEGQNAIVVDLLGEESPPQ